MELMMSHAYMMKPPEKIPKGFKELQVEHILAPEGWYTPTHRCPPRPHSGSPFTWLFVFFIISFNKLANIGKCFSEFYKLLWQIIGT